MRAYLRDHGDMDEPFGDIPRFREIQRLLSAGGGPINLEIARQVAGAVAGRGGAERASADEARSLDDGVHDAEVMVAGYSRLALVEPIRSATMTRSEWASSTLEAWGWILGRLAQRFTGELTKLGAEDAQSMQAAMGQVGPLLMGLQAGTLVGQLSQEVLGRYDLPIPRDDDGRLIFVAANVRKVIEDYGFDATTFYRWLALHEVARHAVVVASPWVDRYMRSLLGDIVDAIEIDTGDLERRFMELQSKGMDALQEGGADTSVPLVPTDRHRRALDRLHAFVALREGYAAHVSDAVIAQVAPGHERVEEGMRRHRLSPSEGQSLLQSVLGVSVDRALETSGATFCAAIVELKGIQALNRVWEAPDNVPTIAEIKDPFAWIDRVLDSEGDGNALPD